MGGDLTHNPTVEWSVCIYRGEQLAQETDIRGLTVEDLRSILGRPGDDPLYDCYPIGVSELAKLAPYCAGQLPLKLAKDESAFVEASQA